MDNNFFFVFFLKKLFVLHGSDFFCSYVLGPAVACDYILSSLYLNYANNVVDSTM